MPKVYAADLDQPTKPVSPAVPAPFFLVNDNRLTFTYIPQSADPGEFSYKKNGGFSGKTSQEVYSFSHFDVWAYGTNFFTVGIYRSGQNDPASPCYANGFIATSSASPVGDVAASCAGATDIFGLLRSTFGFNEVFDTKKFSYGPLNDVSFEIGANFDAQNGYFSSGDRALVAGLEFAFALPYKGYLNVSPLLMYEGNHDGFTQCGNVFAAAAPNCNVDGEIHYRPTAALEANYFMDLNFLPESWRYFSVSGRVAIIAPKGHWQGLNYRESTRTEINSEPIRLTMDVGRLFYKAAPAHTLDIFVAYRYWHNMYGDNQNSAPYVCTVSGVSTNSCNVDSIVTGASVKF